MTDSQRQALTCDLYRLGRRDYTPVWQAMRYFSDHRHRQTRDQLWLVEHWPTYTQGRAGRPEHLLMPTDIPVVNSDRGGQITYHGPGQMIAYLMFDLKRCGLGVRAMVTALENSVVTALAARGIEAFSRLDAPGVYVSGNDGRPLKIASLGLRVRRNCSYHGIAFNINMDLAPFSRINPCGYAGMAMTQLGDLLPAGTSVDLAQETERWVVCIADALNRSAQCPLSFQHRHGDPVTFQEFGGES